MTERDYEKTINMKLLGETRVLFDKFRTLLTMKAGTKIPKTHVIRHAIAITKDFYSGEVGYK
jgi:hypothetical protein